jgi:hypothetical protein
MYGPDRSWDAIKAFLLVGGLVTAVTLLLWVVTL